MSVFFPHFPHVVYFIRVNHPQEFMGTVLSCVSSTFPGQVFKKTLPFMLVNTSAQLAQLLKGYLANCYRKNKRQIWAPRGNGLLLLKTSAKAITICWWCSKGQAYFLFSLPVQYHFLTLALDRAIPSPPPPAQSWNEHCYLKSQKECRYNVKICGVDVITLQFVSTESCFRSLKSGPSSFLVWH